MVKFQRYYSTAFSACQEKLTKVYKIFLKIFRKKDFFGVTHVKFSEKTKAPALSGFTEKKYGTEPRTEREKAKKIKKEKKAEQKNTIRYETKRWKKRGRTRENAEQTRRNEKKQNRAQRKKTKSGGAERDTRRTGIRQDQAMRKEMKRRDTDPWGKSKA